MTNLSLIELASGQRLEHVDAARLVHGVGEMGAVADHPPIHEDRHMPAQRRLVVEDVSAGLRVGGEDIVQHFANRAPGNLGFGAGNVALYVWRERDLGHRWYSFRSGRCVRSTDPRNTSPTGRTDASIPDKLGEKKAALCKRTWSEPRPASPAARRDIRGGRRNERLETALGRRVAERDATSARR